MTGGHTAMKYVADNRDPKILQSFLVLQDRVCVEQSLRRVLMHSIAGIDHGYIEVLRHQQRRPGLRMANNNCVSPHRPQGVPRIEQ